MPPINSLVIKVPTILGWFIPQEVVPVPLKILLNFTDPPMINTEPTRYTVDVGYSIRYEGDSLEYWSLYFGKDILEAIPGKDSRTWDPRKQPLIPNRRHSDLEQMGDLGSSYQYHRLGKANFENESEALGIFQKLGNKEGSEIKMPPASTIGGLSLDYGRLVLEHLKEGHIEDDVMERYMMSYKQSYGRVSKNRLGVVWNPPA
ncbi:hypothetical protein EV368DRAFT_63799 [Lentinula lateritia]|nr:hypothetical protein EV368DRAFT_63799 [Lentinula lateritia]